MKEHVEQKIVPPKEVDFVVESAQEVSGQADAVIVDAVNAVRISHLLKKLDLIDRNKLGAEQEIHMLKAEVQELLASNRGGIKGIHGFIGETSQVHIANIKAFLNGDEPLYILLDDNSMTDYIRGMQIIQQKACRANGYLGLDAIKHHADKYPSFIEEDGIYQIPKDMYKRYAYLRDLPKDMAMKLRKEDYKLWKYIRSFTEERPDIVIEPMEVSYADIQAGNINSTITSVENNVEMEFEKQRDAAYERYAATREEFLKICGISAVIEGGVSAGNEFILKLKSRKRISEFTKQDVKEIFRGFFCGCGKGALRGGIVYITTNILKIPAAVVSGLVTAIFRIGQEGYCCFKKQISKEELKRNSLFIILETVVSTGLALVGKHLCKKHPIVGALAGSILGSAGVNSIRKIVFA